MKSIADLLEEARKLCKSMKSEDIDRQDELLREVLARSESFEEVLLAFRYTHEYGSTEVEAFDRVCQLAQTSAEQEKLIEFVRDLDTGNFDLKDKTVGYWVAFQNRAKIDPTILSDPWVLVEVLEFELDCGLEDDESFKSVGGLFIRADQLTFVPESEPFHRLARLRTDWKSMN